MSFFNIHGPTSLGSLFIPAARTTTANGTSIDVLDYMGVAKAILDSALGTGTTPTLDVKIQDSADNSVFADVAGAVFAQVTAAANVLLAIALDMDAVRRYIRAVATIGGTTPSFTFSVHLVGRKNPAT